METILQDIILIFVCIRCAHLALNEAAGSGAKSIIFTILYALVAILALIAIILSFVKH